MNAKPSDMRPGWVDPDDAPELTDAWFDQAEVKVGERVVRRGRPAGTTKANAKEQVAIRLDPDVLAYFRAGGPGWQSRINETLRKAAGL